MSLLSKRMGRRGAAGSCLAAPFVFLALSATAQAATIYVRTSGSDQNDGLTPATALATIEKAGRSLLNPGDRVVVGAGTYAAANINPIRSGIPGRPIVFHADVSGVETGDPPGPVEIAVRTGLGELSSGFIIYGKRYITIDGFTITGATDPGIHVRPDPVNPVKPFAIHLLNNTVLNGAKTGIQIQASGDVTIRGNDVRHNQGSGISVSGAMDGGLLIQENRVSSNFTSGILVEDASDAIITDNEVRTNGSIGILLRRSDSIVVRGNTLGENGSEAICAGCGIDAASMVHDVDIDSNAILANHRTGIRVMGGGRIGLGDNLITSSSVGLLLLIDDHADLVLDSNVVHSAQQDGVVVRRALASASPSPAMATIVLSANSVRQSFGYGVSLGQSHEPLPHRVTASNNRFDNNGAGGLQTFTQADITVSDNIVGGNGASGISAELFSTTAVADLSRNFVADNSTHGIFLKGAGAGRVDGNTVVESGLNAILVLASEGVVVTRNAISASQVGIAVGIEPGAAGDCNRDGVTDMEDLGTGVAVVLRQVLESACAGMNNVEDLVLAVAASAGGVVTRGLGREVEISQNTLDNHDKTGILALARDRLSVLGNSVSRSRTVGISASAEASGNVLVQGNSVTAPGADGILLRKGMSITIDSNRVEMSGENGIRVIEARDLALTGNQVAQSRRSGLLLSASTAARVVSNKVLDSGSAGISLIFTGSGATATLNNNTVGRSAAGGVFLSGSQRAMIQNNVLFSNGEAGLVLRGAPSSSVINNLIYANLRFGVAIGTGNDASIGSPDAVLASNSIYRNGQLGIVIGTSAAGGVNGVPLPQSPGAFIVNNAFEGNGFSDQFGDLRGGIGISSGSLRGVVTGFNVNPDGYSDGIRVSPYDRAVAPGFVDPDGADGVLGGMGYEDDDFHLRATPADQRSPALDAGSGTAGEIGITGSCVQGANSDSGVIDVCYHYNAAPDQVVHLTLPDLPMFTYVRQSGDSASDGLTPQRAVASIFTAAERATPGTTVVVGPGTYREGDLHVRDRVFGVTFLADPSGQLTGDEPGPVLIDPAGCERCVETMTGTRCSPCDDTAFVLVGTPNITIDGFHITGTRQAGIQVRRGSGGAVVRNNVVFSNTGRGIESLVGAVPVEMRVAIEGVELINNLVYANGSGGIRVSETVNAVVLNNTVYGNGVANVMSDAIFIGNPTSEIPTQGVVLMRNIVQANRDVGIKVDINAREGYVTGFNVALGLSNPFLAYAGNTPRADSDYIADALFVDPAGNDGILGGAGFADDDFRLLQNGDQVSPAVDIDFGEIDTLRDGSTRSDGAPDVGPADAGYHYPLVGAGGVTP